MQGKKLSRRSFLKISAMSVAACGLNWHRIAAYAASNGAEEQLSDSHHRRRTWRSLLWCLSFAVRISGNRCRAALDTRRVCNLVRSWKSLPLKFH